MERTDIQRLLSSILNSQDVDLEDPDEFDAFLDRLRFFFSENILLAALDLVDRDNVVKVSTPWGYSHFNVFGSTATYTVFPGIVSSTQTTPPFCTCPAYAYSVLLSSSELMCKHLIAAAIANRTSRCMNRMVGKDELADVAIRQSSS